MLLSSTLLPSFFPEPSAVQLIVQFMQQAEVEMASLIQNTREQNAAGGTQPLPDIKVENGVLKIVMIF